MNTSYIVCAYFGLFVLGLMDMARGPLYPEILEGFSLGPSVGSYFFSVASFAGLLINLVSRWWLTRWGSFKCLQIFTLLEAIGCFGMGWSANLPNSFAWLLFFSFVFGISLGGTGIVINLLVVEGSPESSHSRLLSGLHTMYGLAALLAPFFVTQVLNNGQNWQACFYLMSVGPCLLLIYSFFSGEVKARHAVVENSIKLSRDGWLMATAMALYVGAEMTLSTRIVVYLRHELLWSADKASNYLVLFFLGLMSGRLVHSVWGGKWSQSLIIWIGSLFSLICFVLGLYVHPLGLSLCGLSMAVIFPTMVALSARLWRKESERIVSVGLAGVGFVLIIMHWTVGFLAEMFNMRLALLIGPLFLLMVLIVLWRLKGRFSEGKRALSDDH